MNGGIRVIGILARELIARGHDVRLFTQPHRSPTLRERARKAIRERKWLAPPRDGPFLDAVLEHVVTLPDRRPVSDADLPDADVVVATWWETAAWVAGLAPSKGAKVYFMQDYGARGQEIEKLLPTWRMPFTFVTLTEHLRNSIRAENPEADVIVMRNAVDHSTFEARSRRRNVPPRIGFIYRAQPSKGSDLALEAIRIVREHLPELRAVAVGSPDAGVCRFVESLRCPGDDALAEFYRSCDLFLFPSRLEGFGLPIVEAMACGTPVVSTKVGAAPDLVRTGENGALVDTDDARSMAREALAILTCPDEAWRRMAENARATVDGYGWDDAAAVFEEALARAVASA